MSLNLAINLKRILLQADPFTIDTTSSTNTTFRTPMSQSINGTSNSTITAVIKRSSTPFDSSMALIALVLLAVLFLLGFFSVYIRRFTAQDPSSPSSGYIHRRNPPPEPNPNRRKGLDAAAVKSLPLVPSSVAAKDQIDVCPICLSEFEERDIVKLIPYCRHVFHPRCIDTWLSSHVTCPVCRSTQLFNRVEEVCLDVIMQEKIDIGACEI